MSLSVPYVTPKGQKSSRRLGHLLSLTGPPELVPEYIDKNGYEGPSGKSGRPWGWRSAVLKRGASRSCRGGGPSSTASMLHKHSQNKRCATKYPWVLMKLELRINHLPGVIE